MRIDVRTLRALVLCLLLLPTLVLAQAPESGPQVAEAAICLGVEDHQPVGEGASFPANTERLYCWTRITGGEGQTVVHAWIHEGVTRARVELEVGSASWRTYSSKRLLPAWTGAWEVKIMTPEGVVLRTLSFVVE